jgi:prepilin signal peptidase PulO-like enzyme (type II secretory pathway)
MSSVSVGAYLVLVGMMVGSFINLAADRLPRGESVIAPRSQCRSCGRVLNLVDLIPVAGYLIRRGRCATCGVSIGLSSPAIELLCGVLVLLPVAAFGLVRGALIGGFSVALVGIAAITVANARQRDARRRESRLG